VWIPKVQRKEPLRNTSPQTKQKLSFDRTIRKPVGASTSKEKSGGIRLSNSFERLAKEDKEMRKFRVGNLSLSWMCLKMPFLLRVKGKPRWVRVVWMCGDFPLLRCYEYPFLEC
jgi:hypothetical protein